MRIKTTNTKNGRLFYVIKTYYDTHGKEHSLTVEKLGNENAIREKYNCDPDVWAKEYVAKLNTQEKILKFDKKIKPLCGFRRFFCFSTVKLPCQTPVFLIFSLSSPSYYFIILLYKFPLQKYFNFRLTVILQLSLAI
ncbi:MAG: hypothetical protein PUD92_03295 [Clostridiales bacterium]|nr:hypothetical protein [Clostridiales bacterium]